jgi:hypothetical protein
MSAQPKPSPPAKARFLSVTDDGAAWRCTECNAIKPAHEVLLCESERLHGIGRIVCKRCALERHK